MFLSLRVPVPQMYVCTGVYVLIFSPSYSQTSCSIRAYWDAPQPKFCGCKALRISSSNVQKNRNLYVRYWLDIVYDISDVKSQKAQ